MLFMLVPSFSNSTSTIINNHKQTLCDLIACLVYLWIFHRNLVLSVVFIHLSLWIIFLLLSHGLQSGSNNYRLFNILTRLSNNQAYHCFSTQLKPFKIKEFLQNKKVSLEKYSWSIQTINIQLQEKNLHYNKSLALYTYRRKTIFIEFSE